ncbi:MAG: hypothetical protein ACE5G3_10285 [Gammaproteobacteria bacterium]
MFMTLRNTIVGALMLVCQAASGDAHTEKMPVTGGVLLIDWDGDFTDPQRLRLKSWLGSVADTVALLHGNLPRERILVKLTAYPSAGAAVPFARVKRRSPQGVKFYVNPAQPLRAFVDDWTAYHEFSHLFIPFPGHADVWFSEGLASYYQNVLQFRAGLLTERQAWQKLHDGFERGRSAKAGGRSDMTLGELSPRMRETRAFMRVYWTGALYFLEADTALRELRNGRVSLDTILREFGDCCLQRRQRWSGASIAAEFDRLAEAEIFVPLYRRYERTTAIPDYRRPLAAAGVDVRDGRVVVVKPGFLNPVGSTAATTTSGAGTTRSGAP